MVSIKLVNAKTYSYKAKIYKYNSPVMVTDQIAEALLSIKTATGEVMFEKVKCLDKGVVTEVERPDTSTKETQESQESKKQGKRKKSTGDKVKMVID